MCNSVFFNTLGVAPKEITILPAKNAHTQVSFYHKARKEKNQAKTYRNRLKDMGNVHFIVAHRRTVTPETTYTASSSQPEQKEGSHKQNKSHKH